MEEEWLSLGAWGSSVQLCKDGSRKTRAGPVGWACVILFSSRTPALVPWVQLSKVAGHSDLTHPWHFWAYKSNWT